MEFVVRHFNLDNPAPNRIGESEPNRKVSRLLEAPRQKGVDIPVEHDERRVPMTGNVDLWLLTGADILNEPLQFVTKSVTRAPSSVVQSDFHSVEFDGSIVVTQVNHILADLSDVSTEVRAGISLVTEVVQFVIANFYC